MDVISNQLFVCVNQIVSHIFKVTFLSRIFYRKKKQNIFLKMDPESTNCTLNDGDGSDEKPEAERMSSEREDGIRGKYAKLMNGLLNGSQQKEKDKTMAKKCQFRAGNSSTTNASSSPLPSSSYKKYKLRKISASKNSSPIVPLSQQLFGREVSGRPLPNGDIFAQSKAYPLWQRDLRAHTGCVNAVDFSPSEEWIVSGGDDLRVRMWKTVDCCTQEKPASSSVTMNAIHHSNIFSLRFSHKTERIYSAGNDQRLLVHDIQTRERLRTYKAQASIYYIATHPTDDNMIAAASEDRNVYLFDLRGNEGDGLCTNHNFVAVCNGKTGLLVYDLRMDTSAYLEAGKMTKKAICADWSPSGELLFCAVSRSNPICFNLINSEHVQLMDPNYSNMCTIKSCSFADDQYMLTGSDDWNIYVWKVPENWEESTSVEEAHVVLKGHRSIVNHVKYGRRSNMLLSCGVEKIVKCWSGFQLRDSYCDAKPRERFSNPPSWFGIPDHGSLDSDTEEDLDTLQRFDFYYEQTLRHRSMHANIGDSDDSSSSNSDMDMELHSMLGAEVEDSDEDGNDQESFFSEITSGLFSPSPSHSPSPQTEITEPNVETM